MKQPIFISIQGSYSSLDVSLYKGSKLLNSFKEDNLRASSLLLPKLENLLKSNSLDINKLNFIAVNQGPGAFTSLRVIITVVNAFAYAIKMPLIGIDGLDALYEQTQIIDNSKDIAVILNAYNNDVYFAYKKNGKLKKGYKKIDLLIAELKDLFKDREIFFSGNAFGLHKDLIEKKLNVSYSNLEISTSKQIAQMALDIFLKNNKDVSFKLTPLYLKSQNFAIRPKKD